MRAPTSRFPRTAWDRVVVRRRDGGAEGICTLELSSRGRLCDGAAVKTALALILALVATGCDALNKSDDAPSVTKDKTVEGVSPSELTKPAKVPEDTWMSFSSEEGRFTTRYPSSPKKEVLKAPSPIGEIPTVMTAATLGDAFFAVAYSDYPKELIEASNRDAMLDGARDGAVNNVQGTLVKEDQITYAGEPARAFEATADKMGIKLKMHSRVFMKENRLYQVTIVYPTTQKDVPLDKFFDAFALKG